MSVTGRIVVTILGRRWPLAITAAAIFAIQSLAVGILVLTHGPAGVVAFVAAVAVASLVAGLAMGRAHQLRSWRAAAAG